VIVLRIEEQPSEGGLSDVPAEMFQTFNSGDLPMARANRTSYKTCFVFMRYENEFPDDKENLSLSGQWQEGPFYDGQEGLPGLLKCYDRETAETIKELILKDINRDKETHTVEIRECECDIVLELQLYSFVQAITQDLQKATGRV
jgi:hypothetical protein